MSGPLQCPEVTTVRHFQSFSLLEWASREDCLQMAEPSADVDEWQGASLLPLPSFGGQAVRAVERVVSFNLLEKQERILFRQRTARSDRPYRIWFAQAY